jgi:hypothetical protein
LLLDGNRDRGGDLQDAADCPPISLMAATESCVSACIPAIWVLISSVALAVCEAKDRIAKITYRAVSCTS